MKKLLGIVVLGLILHGCATPMGQSYNSQSNNDYVAITTMAPDGIIDNNVAFWSLGIFSPKFYDFYSYASTRSEAIRKSEDIMSKLCIKKRLDGQSYLYIVHSKINQTTNL